MTLETATPQARTARPALPLLLALALAACAPGELSRHDPDLRHQPAVERHAAVAVFDRPAGDGALSDYDRRRLVRLADEHARRGAGPMVIATADRALGEMLRAALAETGADIEMKVADVADAPGTAIVRAPVWVARVPECGTFSPGLNPDFDNAPNGNWGCAVNRNRALMLQNPGDLVRARESSGRDGVRAADVLGKYGKGEATSSQAEPNSAASVSTIGK